LQNTNTHYLTRRYIIALSTIALLAIIGQITIQFSLREQTSDARVINIAGRQRMLSQRLSKSALAIETSLNDAQLSANLTEFQDTLELWTVSHLGLQNGNPELGLPGGNSATVQQLYTEIAPRFETMQIAAHCILALNGLETVPDNGVCSEPTTVYTRSILTEEDAFLIGMNNIVFQYDLESTNDVKLLSRIEYSLLTITLVVLFIEAFLIFRPVIRQIEKMLGDLLNTQKQLESNIVDLKVARDEAERANQVKSAFLAAMSHELRTPLNAVINFTKFVAQGDLGPVNESQSETLLEAVSSARHLLNLINDVLDISKIESGSLSLFVENGVSVKEMLEQNTKTAASLLDGKPVEFRTKIAPDLPTIRGDKQRIRQILLNLISNACKFTDEGFIEVQATCANNEITIAVQDTGQGIAADDQSNVFEAFKQTASGIRQGGGTGLGMPISRSLVEAHGGRIWLTSEVGVGTTFFITLPVVSDILEVTLIQ
jgi:signal transduction histidine kinase